MPNTTNKISWTFQENISLENEFSILIYLIEEKFTSQCTTFLPFCIKLWILSIDIVYIDGSWYPDSLKDSEEPMRLRFLRHNEFGNVTRIQCTGNVTILNVKRNLNYSL